MLNIMLGLIGTLVFFCLNILGLMSMLPLYITSPLLFVSLLFTINRFNQRKSFKGF
ncbi:hypothetical protein PJ311_05690 [Bacillus sp. CLL-7-23]|uniref:Uncharacterized protein n=1 Tax=Bacillus changyiensis TaxID=3004103 RepID=A0ABT4X3Y6_9BACI|nr:hypothetical protein [Bacillus changyiensis]MDA7026107.1 hypothetical protein [Bacillus changyiensis]